MHGGSAEPAVIDDARRRQRRRRQWTTGAVLGAAIVLAVVLAAHPWRPGAGGTAQATVAREQRQMHSTAVRAWCVGGLAGAHVQYPPRVVLITRTGRIRRVAGKVTLAEVLQSLTPVVRPCHVSARR